MLAAPQDDLFGFPDVISKPKLLDWKNCACYGCKMDDCNSKHGDYEIMLTENINSIDLLIWSHVKKDGFGEMVLEKSFKSLEVARDYAETWAETEAT